MVSGLVDLHLENYKKSGVELVLGSGHFVGPKTIEVALSGGGTRTFLGENVIINTGTDALDSRHCTIRQKIQQAAPIVGRTVGQAQRDFVGRVSLGGAPLAQFDSSALAVLLAWERAAQARGVKFEIVNLPAGLASLAQAYGVDTLLSARH